MTVTLICGDQAFESPNVPPTFLVIMPDGLRGEWVHPFLRLEDEMGHKFYEYHWKVPQ